MHGQLGESGCFGAVLDNVPDHTARERCPALGNKQSPWIRPAINHARSFGQPVPNCFDLAVKEWVGCRDAVILAFDVEILLGEVNITELELARLRCAQSVTHHEQQQTIVSFRVARFFASFKQFSDFLGG